ncbi:MAG: YcaO-like family protein [Desulfovibrionaceae bacterium]|nr:YcaO-like family protein [Desulfovibrionaceae bacterium]
MELVERFSYFTFWQREPDFQYLTYAKACASLEEPVISVAELLYSVHEDLDLKLAQSILDLLPWNFAPATNLATGEIIWLPLDWFKLLNEFNGASAGNTQEEALLQGLSELVERHVCAEIAANNLQTPTVEVPNNLNPCLDGLLKAFEQNGIKLWLKDFSQGLPLPTIGAIAYDPKTFPEHSEIVFTAGTASDPCKAAIRAITEIAQLGGDFCTNACYEASGLPKFTQLADVAWLEKGPTKLITEIKGVAAPDIKTELLSAINQLAPYHVYAYNITNPQLEIPAYYTIVPGFAFRERDSNQSLGLFVGRRLVEEADLLTCKAGLHTLEEIYGTAHFMPFFKGMLALREENFAKAVEHFSMAIDEQPNSEAQGLCAFYTGYALSQTENFAQSIPYLEQALNFSQDMYAAANLLGVCHYKLQDYAKARDAFHFALRLNKGSALDLANLGLCEQHLQLTELAREHLEAALELDPSIDFARKALENM